MAKVIDAVPSGSYLAITHMASEETVAENLLLLQVDFLRKSLGVANPPV